MVYLNHKDQIFLALFSIAAVLVDSVTLLRQMQLVSKIIFGYDAATH